MANLLFAPENLTRSGLKTPEGVSLHAGWYNLAGSMLRPALGLLGKADRIVVERAIAEIRMARPVLIGTSSEAALAVSIEGLDADLCAALDRVLAGRARLVLPATRLRRLGVNRLMAGTI